jgi:hypothetical protein
MKSLYWEEPGQLAFRNSFNTKMEEIGLALPANSFRETNAFIRGGNSIIF